MTPRERAAFDALRILVGVLDEQTDANMLSLLEDTWDRGAKLRELREKRRWALQQARAALALAQKAEAETDPDFAEADSTAEYLSRVRGWEPVEPVVRLTRDMAGVIKAILMVTHPDDTPQLAAAREQALGWLAAAIKAAEGGA